MAAKKAAGALDAETRSKIDKLREKWTKAAGRQKAANMEAGAEKKATHDAVLASAVKLGIPKPAWRDFMTEMDHVDDTLSHREKVVAVEDADRLRAYDRMMLAQEDVLPLFSSEVLNAMHESADSEPAEEDEDKVADLDERRAAKAEAKAAGQAEAATG